MSTYTFQFADKNDPIVQSFNKDGAVDPYVADKYITELVEAAGGEVVEHFHPEEQMSHDAASGYVRVDMAVILPGLGHVWLGIECPADSTIPEQATS